MLYFLLWIILRLYQSGIKDFIEEYIDMDIIKNSDKELYACAYNVDKERI